MAKVVCHPAEADEGVFFVNKNGDRLSPSLESLVSRPLRTAFEENDFSVETGEHLLAAVEGLGISNLKIEIEGVEPPALDGSAKNFAEEFIKVGLLDQECERQLLAVKESVVIEDSGGKITAVPYSKGLKVTYILSGEGLPDQVMEYEHSSENFMSLIAGARTFCRQFEVEALRSTPGVGDGADESNTLLVDLQDLDQKQRMPNELAAHKILDLLGDLSLSGKEVRGHLICHRSGHSCNHALLRALKRQSGECVMNINVIKDILPHAYPFLLVDRIIDFEANKKVVGLKNVTVNEPFFPGHFPDEPIMPGVLLIEALAQTGAVFIYRNQGAKEKKLVLFTGVDKVKFRHRVVPGDQVILEVEAKTLKAQMGLVKARATVAGALACEAELKFMIVDKG
jgi:UDP-3-O-[3-hydroxymyristoyl] N-acetylglucosamine deacetylase/3-hydroxyacyl-[acyl-carrier-protein] dehydratase